MFRTLGVLAAIFAVALAAVGLTFRASVERPADFRFINGTEPKSLDPGLVTGRPGGRVVSAIFEGLTRYDEATLRPLPAAAESWTVSPDGRRYEFRIRAEAIWSDGQPVTAHDFAYAWRRLQDPLLASEYAYILHMVRFAEELNTWGGQVDRIEGPIAEALAALRRENPRGVAADAWQAYLRDEGVADACKGTPDRVLAELLARSEGRVSAEELGRAARALTREAERRRAVFEEANRRYGVDAGVFALDDRTLVVELDAPTPYFLSLTAFTPSFPVPRWRVEAKGDEHDWFLPEKIVSNGPFRLESWRVNDRIRLVRNELYWGREDVALGVIDIFPIEGETTSLNLYLSGEVDWLPSTYPTDLAGLLRERADFYATPGLAVYYYKINCERPPFDDPRIRKALNLAIDREEIVRHVLRLGQIEAYHLVPPGMAGYSQPGTELRLDLEAARQLLAEAGYPGGQGLGAIGILYNTLESHKKIAEVIADQLRRGLGIEIEAYNQEWQSYLHTIRDRDYDLARAGWYGDYTDPNTFLDMWITEGGNNQTGWSHALYDRLIAWASDVEAFVRSGASFDAKQPEALARAVAEIGTAVGPEARRAALGRLRMHLLSEAEAILVQDEFPIIPLYFYVNSGLLRPEVRGFYSEFVGPQGEALGWNLQDRHPLRGMSVVGREAQAGEAGL